MKRQIHAYKGHGEIAVEGHNIKLGRGGIREIEFFAQTQQLIAGGRHPELRGRETLATLDDARRGRLDRQGRGATISPRPIASCASSSTGCRWSPTSRPIRCRPSATGVERFARFLGFAGPRRVRGGAARASAQGAAPLRAAVRGRAGGRGLAPRARLSARQGRHRERSTSSPRWASAARSKSPARCAAGSPASIARSRASSRARIWPTWCRCCSIIWRARKIPTRALVALDRFLAGLHGGARLLSLLRQNPDLIALLALVLGTAPRLADILARASAGDGRADRAVLLRRAARCRQARRRAVAHARRRRAPTRICSTARALFGQEQMFLIGARILSGTVSARAGGRGLRAPRRRDRPRACTAPSRRVSPQRMAACAGRRARCWRSASSAAAR